MILQNIGKNVVNVELLKMVVLKIIRLPHGKIMGTEPIVDYVQYVITK